MNPKADFIGFVRSTRFYSAAAQYACLDRVVSISASHRPGHGIVNRCPVLVKRDVSAENIINQFNADREEGGVDVDFPSPPWLSANTSLESTRYACSYIPL